jgi:hypothetical protein
MKQLPLEEAETLLNLMGAPYFFRHVLSALARNEYQSDTYLANERVQAIADRGAIHKVVHRQLLEVYVKYPN